ncbi:MAG: cysteine desulfurase [Candidatus Hadarchaeales archaeon]
MPKSVSEVRAEIPFLRTGIRYLDSASTSLKPQPVIDAIVSYFTEFCVNVGRGVYSAAVRATEAFEATREKIARVIGAKPREIAYTKSTTEAINAVASGLSFKPGDRVIVSRFEHHSNFLPWERLSGIRGVKLDVVGSSRDCVLDPSEFERKLHGDVRLVVLHHVSNSVGSVQPVKEIARISRDNGSLCLVDAAQSVGHMPVDVEEIGCDYLAAPGHKGLMGPPGTGFLYVREGSPVPEPLLTGGGVIKEGCKSFEYSGFPQSFDAGTPNVPGIVGLGAGCDYVLDIGPDNILRRESELVKELLKIREIAGVEVYGPMDTGRRAGIVSFNVRNFEPNAVAKMLDLKGFAVRSGHHCAIPTMQHIGVNGTVRASVGYYNTREDVEKFVEAVSEIASGGM